MFRIRDDLIRIRIRTTGFRIRMQLSYKCLQRCQKKVYKYFCLLMEGPSSGFVQIIMDPVRPKTSGSGTLVVT
jgi:hypothetical protein